MKLVQIVTRPEKLEDIKSVLDNLNIHGMTVSMVSGCGLQKGRKEVYRGAEININLLPKIKIEVVMDESKVQNAVTEICMAVRTGEVGDGKIFISNIENVIRIRTGEKGKEAL